MFNKFKELDRIIRGQATAPGELRDGQLKVRVGSVLPMLLLLGAVYGACMGAFGMINRATDQQAAMQIVASMVKVPMLFILTLVVTFPSLYVFNALVGSRLDIRSVARLITIAVTVTMTVLSSMATIVLFFSFTTTSYPFMLLLNVVVFAVSGALGLSFLRRTLHRLTQSMEPVKPWASETQHKPSGPLDPSHDDASRPQVGAVFRVWMIVYALVGAQMSWVMRPFVGNPKLDFEWFRPRESNFFEAVWQLFRQLIN